MTVAPGILSRDRLVDVILVVLFFVLVALRLVLTSDLSVQINYAPHDDSLYVERALRLLSGEAFGSYDSNILVKYPGISLWLAGLRTLGIPFLLSINALYIGGGIYLMAALFRTGISRWVVLVAFALYLFNPITFGYEWIRVIREPLDTGLLVVLAGAMAHVLLGLQEGRIPWRHLAVFAVVFAFALFVREENQLLWGLLGLFFFALLWQATRHGRPASSVMAFLAAALIVPAALGKAYEFVLRDFAERHYGLPILHEFGEGEYPRLLAAIRSIESAKDNRLVMVTQEALQKLRTEVPAFAPVVERLPKPGTATFSCQLHGVCSEWSNGWMPFWIKDEAFRAGLTPNLPAAQDYFRRVRLDIEQACEGGRLRCREKGEGFLQPMELRWTRAYLAEGWRLGRMALAPDINFISQPPVVFDVPLHLGRVYQAVTMAHYFDSQAQASLGVGTESRIYSNPLARFRATIVGLYQPAVALLLLAALVALALRLWIADRVPLGPLALIGAVVGLYALFRLAVMAYVAVFIGPFTGRIVFSTYAATVVLALPFIAETVSALRNRKATTANA